MTTKPAVRRPLSRRRRVLFALVPLLAVCLVAEVVIRLVRAPTHFGSFRELRTDLLKRNYPAQRHPVLGYVPQPGASGRDNHWGTLVSIDQDGMRRNGDGPTPAGDRVLAAVGDSFTFGDQVDDDASWPACLERRLQQPVKNGGVFGYSLAQAVLRAEDMLARFPVGTLVVAFIPDDLTRCEYSRRYTPQPVFELDGDGLALRNVPLDHDAVANDAGKAWKDALGHSALVDAILANTLRAWWFENEKQVTAPGLQGKGPEIGKRLLARIAAACKPRDVRLLVVLLGDKPTDAAIDVLRDAAGRGIATLDLASRFVELERADASLKAKWFAGHMTRHGNDWVAGEIAAALRTVR
ncbi:MAG: hypothetical protein JNK15_05705 [Planctomycetes bacterium]|nr:hypothetical protein [Planctomycetota bacterium]